jgi:hypothetical protein
MNVRTFTHLADAINFALHQRDCGYTTRIFASDEHLFVSWR